MRGRMTRYTVRPVWRGRKYYYKNNKQRRGTQVESWLLLKIGGAGKGSVINIFRNSFHSSSFSFELEFIHPLSQPIHNTAHRHLSTTQLYNFPVPKFSEFPHSTSSSSLPGPHNIHSPNPLFRLTVILHAQMKTRNATAQ